MNIGDALPWMLLIAYTLFAVQPAATRPRDQSDLIADQDARPDISITVLSYNYAEVPQQILVKAVRETTRIFRRIGITIEWVHCPIDRRQNNQLPVCDSQLGQRNLELRFLSQSMSERAGMARTALGIAVQPFDGRVPVRVAWPRVQQTAAHNHLSAGTLLGHAIAHELGHVLLGQGEHSSSGLMHECWTQRELAWAMEGSLNFSPWEAEAMRSNLIPRR